MKISYELTHYHAIDKSKYNLKFKTTLRQHYLCQIIAYIQFLTDEIKHASEVGGIEIALLLKSFYDSELEFIDMDEPTEWTIDEYDNWEFYCSGAEGILNNKEFHREGLHHAIQHLLTHQEVLLDTVIK